MTSIRIINLTAAACFALVIGGCRSAQLPKRAPGQPVPPAYSAATTDSTNAVTQGWNAVFTDPALQALIDTALANNQELAITRQEIEISRNEVRARKGEYLPTVGIRAGAGLDKVGRYTVRGATEATTEIRPGHEMPEPVPDLLAGVYANWELDIWKKLRNAKKAAVSRYLGSIEGRNFMVTNLIAEIANAYYELLALDNQLLIVQKNLEIQNGALRIVRLQKESARVTELAVRRFEAQVLGTQNLQYGIRQQIVETENRINFLLGRYPQPIVRNDAGFESGVPQQIRAGIPSQLLANRPDIRRAEQELVAAKLDVKVARARFYPSIGLTAGIGFQAFNPGYLLKSPESLLYSLAGDLVAPLVNRNAIKAAYYSANAKQIQALIDYERTVLKAYLEVVNQLSKIENLQSSYNLRAQQVEKLGQSIRISNDLFLSARADYMEVLLTQRESLEARFELIDTRKQQMAAMVNVYQALGGGWR